MPNIIDLGRKFKQKYPGAYDDLSDQEVGQKVKQKFPGSYDDFVDLPQRKPGLLERAANIGDKTFGAAGNALFGTTAKIAGSMLGNTYENAAQAFGRKKTGVFEKTLDQAVSTPKELAKNSVGLLLEGTTGGLGEKTFGKIANAVKTPLTKIATKLYTSALKPTGKLAEIAPDLVKTGLKERIFLTKGGVEKVATKIDDFENQLGNVIDAAKDQGITIKTSGLKGYLDEAKKFFSDDVDIAAGKKAIKEIDRIGSDLVKKYGDEIPIDVAQRIKVATGQHLRKYYTSLSSSNIEARKQATRFLKDKIVDAAPEVGKINERLKNLYQFDQALNKAQGKVRNLNLLGLPSKIAASTKGIGGLVVGKALEYADAPAAKSAAAIGLDALAKGGGKLFNKARVPISAIANNILKLTGRQ
jgi:hypothetical protein